MKCWGKMYIKSSSREPYNCHKPLFIYLKKVQTPLFRTYIASYSFYNFVFIKSLYLLWICSISVCMNTSWSTWWTGYMVVAKRQPSKQAPQQGGFRTKETESSTFETRARHRAPKKCNKMVSITIYTFGLRLCRPSRNIICCKCRWKRNNKNINLKVFSISSCLYTIASLCLCCK